MYSDYTEWMLNIVSSYTNMDKEVLDKSYSKQELDTLYKYYIDIFKEEFNSLLQANKKEIEEFSKKHYNAAIETAINRIELNSHHGIWANKVGKNKHSISKDGSDTLLPGISELYLNDFLITNNLKISNINGSAIYTFFKDTIIGDSDIPLNTNVDENAKREISLFFCTLIYSLTKDGVLLNVLKQRVTDMINSNNELTVETLQDKLINSEDNDDYRKIFRKIMDNNYAFVLDILNELVKEHSIDLYISKDTNIENLLKRHIIVSNTLDECIRIRNTDPINIMLNSIEKDNVDIRYFVVKIREICNSDYYKYNLPFEDITIRNASKIHINYILKKINQN